MLGSAPHPGPQPGSDCYGRGAYGGRGSARRTGTGPHRPPSSSFPYENQTPAPIAEVNDEPPAPMIDVRNQPTAPTVEGCKQPQEKSRTVQVIQKNKHTCLSSSSSELKNE